MKKFFIVLLLVAVLAGSAFAKSSSSFMAGATAGVDFFWGTESMLGIENSKTSDIGMPLFASVNYFFNKNLGVFADVGANIGLSTKINNQKVDTHDFFTAAFGVSYKTKLNKNIDVIASAGAEIYSYKLIEAEVLASAKVTVTSFQFIMKGQAMLKIADGIKLIPGVKTSLALLKTYTGKFTYSGKTETDTEMPDKFFGFSVAPIIGIGIEF